VDLSGGLIDIHDDRVCLVCLARSLGHWLFALCGLCVFALLAKVAHCGCLGFRKVYFYIFACQCWPGDKVSILYGFEEVDMDGLKHAMWRNCMVSAMVPAGMMLLARPEAPWLVVLSSSSVTRQRLVRSLR
jgi:hypothetical protein